jgi:predicted NBD/HSP70 family sugar kinase
MEHVLQAALGEPVILQDFLEIGRYLGIGISNLLNAFNPALAVLGGILSLAEPYLLPRAQHDVDARALAVSRRDAKNAVSAFKFDAGVMGGVSLIRRELLSNPSAWQPAPVAPGPMNLRMAASFL